MKLEYLFPKEKIQILSPSDWRYRMILDVGLQAEETRGCVSRLLNFAEDQRVLDDEMTARLGNGDYDQFRSAIHEIAVGEFLSSVGTIDWRPPGRASRIGELNFLPKGYEPIFVELKTMFVSSEERRRDKNWDVLRKVAHGILSPFVITVEFLKLECDIVPRHFRPWLKRQITYLKKELTKEGEQKVLIFKDRAENGSNTEVAVKFIRLSDNDLPTRCGHTSGGFSNLHERVIEVIDGALSQLPDNQPTLVVIAGTEWVGLDKFSMIAAMFSLPKVTYTLVTDPAVNNKQQKDSTIHYDLQGIVQKSMRRRLSAVGVWHQKWTQKPSGTLDIYHNPLATKQIPCHVLEMPNVCQLVPKEMGTMKWMPGPPPQ